jgi:hypothetical protein
LIKSQLSLRHWILELIYGIPFAPRLRTH